MPSRRILYLKKEVDEKKTKKRKLLVMSFLVLMGILIGTGAIVHNLSELYMLDKNTAQVNTPVRMMKDGSNVFLVSAG